ncbi:16385_t:CDS:2, partial [Racocetra persica]
MISDKEKKVRVGIGPSQHTVNLTVFQWDIYRMIFLLLRSSLLKECVFKILCTLLQK